MTLRGAIVDLDGTVYRGGDLVDGAATGIDALRAAGADVLFFSNNPLKDGDAYLDHLAGLGLDVDGMQACSAGVVTTEYLQAHHADEEILLIGDDGLREQLRAADLLLTTDPDQCDVLVASWTESFDYGDMQTALDAVGPDTVFLGSDPDRTFPMEDGGLVPGSGAIIGAVAAVVGRDPDAILGKPSEAALSAALDRLDTDLRMGDRAGMTTVLTLSGVTDRADIADSDIEPDFIIETLGDVDAVLAEL
ncbi:HAD family hydrolase [Halobacteriales archaeon QH_2_66_30]|nr:MAG: HAD family hydrolase [Halobacteriales archaeon QH_2_66_30]